jgi:WhiB family transcriptional regulator, redox-sensing transcriptional regulator
VAVKTAPSLVNVAEVFDFAGFAAQTWRSSARCRGQDPERWHPVRGQNLEPLRRICRHCPVRLECLSFALATSVRETNGVWGGSSSRDRRKARRHGWDARQLLAYLDGDG